VHASVEPYATDVKTETSVKPELDGETVVFVDTTDGVMLHDVTGETVVIP